MLFNSKDEVSLLLVGTEESENILADKKSGYKNISNARDFEACNIDFLKMIDDLLLSENQTGDSNISNKIVLEAIDIAYEMFFHRYANKKYTKRVFLY